MGVVSEVAEELPTLEQVMQSMQHISRQAYTYENLNCLPYVYTGQQGIV